MANHTAGRAGPCEPGFAVVAIVTFTLTSFLNRLGPDGIERLI